MNMPITELMFFTADGKPSFKPSWPRRPEDTRKPKRKPPSVKCELLVKL